MRASPEGACELSSRQHVGGISLDDLGHRPGDITPLCQLIPGVLDNPTNLLVPRKRVAFGEIEIVADRHHVVLLALVEPQAQLDPELAPIGHRHEEIGHASPRCDRTSDEHNP